MKEGIYMGKVVGIDLGTTFSAVSYIDKNGNAQIIPNRDGENITPSTVLFDDEEVIVGKQAKKSAFLHPTNYESFVKRHMGERDYQFVSENGEKYSAEAISAIILKKLKADAEAYLGDSIDGAVITVPAFFSDVQRTSTMDAAKMAGINTLAIINEPTAAALAYGISKGSSEPKTVLVYDLGGGTFDVTIIKFTENEIEPLATDGNRQLGGFDFDNKIVDFVIEEAKKQGLDINKDAKARQALQNEAEEAKKTLSERKKAEISLYICGQPFDVTITRDQFESMISSLLFRTINVMESAMEEAGLEYSDLDKILLVGGSTRIPAVAKSIEEETGIKPSQDIHPDEAVAIGAAFYAVDIAKKNLNSVNSQNTSDNNAGGAFCPPSTDLPDNVESYQFRDITAHGIGIVIEDDLTGEDINSVILPKNTKVPAEYREQYATQHAYQDTILLQVTQGEDTELKYVTIIGETELKVKPKPEPFPIEVIISCDSDSIIHVRVIDLVTNEDLGEMKIDRVNNLSDQEVQKETNRLGKLNIGDE